MGENEQMDDLEREIERLRLENENLRLKLESNQGNRAWIWALIPITAIVVGGFSEIWTKIIDVFF
ncbi:hypothetical protein [uncultured Enterococcus sp.]|uniref:hypothetical protein n=1 Tax=uncultured Enterococcus sp. TaxID=167972 RepID=UPI0025E6B95C|nr:hypothetical protein [uncultured Enterococcus sp.]